MAIGQDYLSILMAQIAQQGGQLAVQPAMPPVSGGGTPQQGGMRRPQGGTPQQGGMRRPSGHRMQQVRPMQGNMPMPPQMGGEFESLDARMAMAKAQSMSPNSFQGGGARGRAPQEAMALEKAYRQKQEGLAETQRQQVVMQVAQAGHKIGMSQDEIDKFAAEAYNDPEMGAQWLNRASSHPQIQGAVMKMTGDPHMAKYVADLSMTDPDSAKVLFTQISEKAYDTTKGTTVNVGNQDPLAPFIEAALKRGEEFPDPTRMFNTQLTPEERMRGNTPIDPLEEEKEEKRATSTIDKAARVNLNIDRAINLLDENPIWSPAGMTGAITRKFAQMFDKPSGEGEMGLFERDTDAGELISIIDPIKSTIAQEFLNQMREMSSTGGALGNVSNFEVRMLQSSIASLEQARSPEGLRQALGDVKIAFSRAAFLAAQGRDMEEQALKMGLEEKDIPDYIRGVMRDRYPIDAAFEKRIQQVPEWKGLEDDTPPMAVDPNEPITIPTEPEGVMTAAEYMQSLK